MGSFIRRLFYTTKGMRHQNFKKREDCNNKHLGKPWNKTHGVNENRISSLIWLYIKIIRKRPSDTQ